MSDDLKSFPVGDLTSEIQIDRRWLDVDDDLMAAGSDIAANIGKCADVLADRVQRLEMIEADFRRWKAKKKMSYLATEPKLAEWKCKERYRVEKDYREANLGLSECRADIEWINGFQRALEVKARMVDLFMRFDRRAEAATTKAGLTPGHKRGRVRPTSADREL